MNKLEWKGKGKWNKDTFLILLLVGVLLFIIALPMDNRKAESTSKPAQEAKKETEVPVTSDKVSKSEEQSYTKQLERQLEDALQYMEGAGRVKVMLTVRSSAEQVVEKDSNNSRLINSETDSEGGSRNQNEVSSDETTVYQEDEEGRQSPYVVKQLLPDIEGVIVIAQGGGSSSVAKNITEAVQALFGIEPHKIKVIKMRE